MERSGVQSFTKIYSKSSRVCSNNEREQRSIYFSTPYTGIMILIFKPFGVGDFIECGDVTGTVEEVSLFYTTVRSATNQRITAPNSDLSSAHVINYSIYDTRRLDIDFEVAYGSDKNAVVRGIGMPEDAIAEKINEAFADNFGDVVLELSDDGEYRVIEDYFEEIGEGLRKITK